MGVVVHGFLNPPLEYTKEETVEIIKQAVKEKWPGVKITFRWGRATGCTDHCDVTFYTDDISVSDMRDFCSQFNGSYSNDDGGYGGNRHTDVGDHQIRYSGVYMAGPKRSKKYDER